MIERRKGKRGERKFQDKVIRKKILRRGVTSKKKNLICNTCTQKQNATQHNKLYHYRTPYLALMYNKRDLTGKKDYFVRTSYVILVLITTNAYLYRIQLAQSGARNIGYY